MVKSVSRTLLSALSSSPLDHCLRWMQLSVSTPLLFLPTHLPIPSHLEALPCSCSPLNLHPLAFGSLFHLPSPCVSISKPFLLFLPLSAAWLSHILVCVRPHLHTKPHLPILLCESIAYSQKQYNTNQSSFPNGKSTLTWGDTPFPFKNARSTSTWASANAVPEASRHSHFRWDSKVRPSAPGVAREVNGVLTEDVTVAIKMQITSRSKGCPESALHKPG